MIARVFPTVNVIICGVKIHVKEVGRIVEITIVLFLSLLLRQDRRRWTIGHIATAPVTKKLTVSPEVHLYHKTDGSPVVMSTVVVAEYKESMLSGLYF